MRVKLATNTISKLIISGELLNPIVFLHEEGLCPLKDERERVCTTLIDLIDFLEN